MMTARGLSTTLCLLCWASGLSAVPAYALDVHLQELPPAPGLMPSEPLDPLEGVRNAVNCGLDFLGTAQRCGLSTPYEAASPFLVSFDPLYCRLTMRFAIGEVIDGLLSQWLAGAFARLGSPAIGALCLLGIGPQYCPSTTPLALPTRFITPRPTATPAATMAPESRSPETHPHDATGLDRLTR